MGTAEPPHAKASDLLSALGPLVLERGLEPKDFTRRYEGYLMVDEIRQFDDLAWMQVGLPIPTKPPVYNGMIAPRDSWMMPPPCNEMIPPGAPRLLAERVFSPCGVAGQAVLDCLPRARRRLSPVSSMRCALCTRRSRMASA